MLLGEERYLEAALEGRRAAWPRVQRADGWLAGTYEDGWVPTPATACLTGVAQMSLNWTAPGAGHRAPTSCARTPRSALAYLKTTASAGPTPTRPCAAASPVRRRSGATTRRFEYPNWAAKFFADALMMDMADIAVPPVPRGRRSRGMADACMSRCA